MAQRQAALGLLHCGDVDGRVGLLAAAREEPRHDEQRHERRCRHAERHRRLARGDPDHDREREQDARDRLEQDEQAVELEALVAGEKAACEVARRVGEDADDEHPVQRRRTVEEIVLERVSQDERDRQERQRERPLDQ